MSIKTNPYKSGPSSSNDSVYIKNDSLYYKDDSGVAQVFISEADKTKWAAANGFIKITYEE